MGACGEIGSPRPSASRAAALPSLGTSGPSHPASGSVIHNPRRLSIAPGAESIGIAGGATNRVGGGLATPVPPHHRTYLRIRRFLSTVQRRVPLDEIHQPKRIEPALVHRLLRSGAARQTPPASGLS